MQFHTITGLETDLSDASVRKLATTIKDIQETLKDEMAKTQEVHRQAADKQQHLPPWFFPNDMVLLGVCNIYLQQP